MSVVLLGESRAGSGGVRKNGQYIELTQTKYFRVLSDTKTESLEAVLSCAGLPIVNITALGNGAVCIDKKGTRDETNPLLWNVTAEYTTAQNDQRQDNNNQSDNPVTWIPIWRADIESEDIATWVDAQGRPYVNSAYQKFDEGRLKKIEVAVTKFTQYESAGQTLRSIMDRHLRVNSQDFNNYPAKRLLLMVNSVEYGRVPKAIQLPGVPGFVAYWDFWKIEYTCKYKKGLAASAYKTRGTTGNAWAAATDNSGWLDLRLDVGWYYISAGKRIPTTDENSNRILGGLDGAGNVVAYNAMPAILGFDEFEAIDFSTFLRI